MRSTLSFHQPAIVAAQPALRGLWSVACSPVLAGVKETVGTKRFTNSSDYPMSAEGINF